MNPRACSERQRSTAATLPAGRVAFRRSCEVLATALARQRRGGAEPHQALKTGEKTEETTGSDGFSREAPVRSRAVGTRVRDQRAESDGHREAEIPNFARGDAIHEECVEGKDAC